MFAHIIVAWDGSDHAQRAFQYGIEIAKRFEAKLQLVSVVKHDEHALTHDDVQESRRRAHDFYRESAGALVESGNKHGIKTELLVVEGGHPAEAIVDTARKVGADLIILGRRGRSGMTRFLIGSVSDRIARYAHCPVLLIDGYTTLP